MVVPVSVTLPGIIVLNIILPKGQRRKKGVIWNVNGMKCHFVPGFVCILLNKSEAVGFKFTHTVLLGKLKDLTPVSSQENKVIYFLPV